MLPWPLHLHLSTIESWHDASDGSIATHINMRSPILLALAATPLLLNSCATVIQGKTDEVTFASVQKGASIEVDGQKSKTPATLTISKKTTSATFSHPNYSSKKIEWKRDYQKGFVVLNVILTPGWGTTGMATDTATGAIWDQPKMITYDFKTGTVSLDKSKGKPSDPPKTKDTKPAKR